MSTHMLIGIIAALLETELETLQTRGEGIVVTFTYGNQNYRMQLDPFTRKGD